MDSTGNRSGKRSTWLLIFVILAVAVAGILYSRRHATKPASTRSGCVTQTQTIGSSGSCVADVQNMINYIETSGLNECPFVNGKTLTVTGTYDTKTSQQVKVVQTWTNCYNKQEGSNQTVAVTGNVDVSTWTMLCSYGYKFAKQSQSSTSPYRTAAINAGKAAGCQ